MNQCVVYVGGDAYEIYFDLKQGVRSIVRYRGGRDIHGEDVDYDELTPPVQQAIRLRLKREIQRLREFTENGDDTDNSANPNANN